MSDYRSLVALKGRSGWWGCGGGKGGGGGGVVGDSGDRDGDGLVGGGCGGGCGLGGGGCDGVGGGGVCMLNFCLQQP